MASAYSAERVMFTRSTAETASGRFSSFRPRQYVALLRPALVRPLIHEILSLSDSNRMAAGY
jgi:hypothetical protein